MSYKNSSERNRRLYKLYLQTKARYGCGVYFDNEKNRYIRYSCHRKSVKKVCRKTTRRRLKNNFDSGKNMNYKRVYDYWWEIL